jgi:thiamine biosynthesis protein ThiS
LKIRVKTGGLLNRYLPSANGNIAEVEVADGATADDVMRQLGFPAEDSYLVSLNGSVVPRAKRAAQGLNEGDQLAVMPPLKGG